MPLKDVVLSIAFIGLALRAATAITIIRPQVDASSQKVGAYHPEVAACTKHLRECWLHDTQSWRASQSCVANKGTSACSSVCSSWIADQCDLDRTECLTVAEVCGFLDAAKLVKKPIQEGSGRFFSSEGSEGVATLMRDYRSTSSKIAEKQSTFDGASTRPAVEELQAKRKKMTKSAQEANHRGSGTQWSYLPEAETILLDIPLVFLHIPMSFGTAVEEVGALYDQTWGLHRDSSQMTMRDGYKCHVAYVPPSLLPIPNMYTNREVFTVVRHPYDRVVAEYKHLLAVDWGGAWGSEIYRYKACTEKGLNFWLESTLTKFLRGERYINDCHMLPQTEYIKGTFRRFAQWELGDVIHAENPERFNELMQNRNHSVRMDKFVDSHENVCPKLTAKSLTSGAKALLNTVYFEDFQNLHYEMG